MIFVSNISFYPFLSTSTITTLGHTNILPEYYDNLLIGLLTFCLALFPSILYWKGWVSFSIHKSDPVTIILNPVMVLTAFWLNTLSNLLLLISLPYLIPLPSLWAPATKAFSQVTACSSLWNTFTTFPDFAQLMPIYLSCLLKYQKEVKKNGMHIEKIHICLIRLSEVMRRERVKKNNIWRYTYWEFSTDISMYTQVLS